MRMHGSVRPHPQLANKYEWVFYKLDMKRELAKYYTKDLMIMSKRNVNNADKQAVCAYPA